MAVGAGICCTHLNPPGFFTGRRDAEHGRGLFLDTVATSSQFGCMLMLKPKYTRELQMTCAHALPSLLQRAPARSQAICHAQIAVT